jgi:hypothetical protein
MTDNKELKVEFAPGAFDHFEGTQEELDALLVEIQKMFEGKTAEEIQAMSRPLSDEDFDDLPEEVQMQLLKSVDEEDLEQEFKRKLQ